nr:MAG TPA: hypothetical protein [Microviridae sp.]
MRRDVLPHSAIYIKYIAARLKFKQLFRFFNIITGCSLNSSLISNIIEVSSVIKKSKAINSWISQKINITGMVGIIRSTRKRLTAIIAREVDTTTNVERRSSINTNILTKRIRFYIIRTFINSLSLSIHSSLVKVNVQDKAYNQQEQKKLP